MFLLHTISAALLACLASASTLPVNRTVPVESVGPGSPIEVGISGVANPGALLSGSENSNETMEFDFVNLPGYGVVDEANSTVNGSFSCYERRYGYYADVSRSCQMFHLCYPVREPQTQQIVYQRFSFVCSENAVFDQAHLVCVDNDTSPISCEESVQYYEVSNDRLLESLQATQPGLFALEEEGETGGGNETAAAASNGEESIAVGGNHPAGQPYAVYNLRDEFYR